MIDRGESIREGLAREVFEETGLDGHRLGGPAYSVVVEAPQLGWRLRVEAWEAADVVGDIVRRRSRRHRRGGASGRGGRGA